MAPPPDAGTTGSKKKRVPPPIRPPQPSSLSSASSSKTSSLASARTLDQSLALRRLRATDAPRPLLDTGTVAELLSDAELAALQREFEALDADGDGAVTAAEAGSSDTAGAWFGVADADGDGRVTLAEFMAVRGAAVVIDRRGPQAFVASLPADAQRRTRETWNALGTFSVFIFLFYYYFYYYFF
jgi:hypothetical protein